MIDLSHTEQQMLAEIAYRTCANSAATPTAHHEGPPPETSWRVTGHTPYEVLAVLRRAFFRRYAHLPRAHVSANLVDLVKHGLGNAYKRGNARDAEKLLTVMTVMTDTGAVIKVTDQGHGFDVRRVVEQFARQECYFVHAGSGFSHFQRTSSVVSFADGGRTLLIRFLARDHSDGTHAQVSKTRRIDFAQLMPRDQVKVKGMINRDGSVTAMKVSVKPADDVAVIQAPLQHVDDGRAIRVLNAQVILSDSTGIASVHGERLEFEALRAGQVVELTGSYSCEAGFAPVRLHIRNESSPEVAVLKGRIEEISRVAATLCVLGITVIADDQTELIDKRQHG